MRILTTVSVIVLSFCLVAGAFAQEEGKGGKGQRARGGQGAQGQRGGRGQQRGRGGQMRRGGQQGAINIDRMLQALDKNKDGQLSKDEVPPRMQQGFDRIDTNSDGTLDQAELKKLAGLMRGMQRGLGQQGQGQQGKGRGMRRGGQGQQGDGNQRKGKGGMGQGRQIDPAQALKRMDKNNDGKVTKNEVPERMQERFEQMDANGDGSLDAAEFKTVMERLMQRGGQQGQRGGQMRRRGNGGEQKGSVKPKRPGK